MVSLFNGSSGSLRNFFTVFPVSSQTKFFSKYFRILHQSGKILSAMWIRQIGFRSYGYSVKLCFGTFNSVKLIFGRMGFRQKHVSVKLIQENDQGSAQTGSLDFGQNSGHREMQSTMLDRLSR